MDMQQEPGYASLKHLVRTELGCACPDRVFEHIRELGAQRCFSGLPGDRLFAIGDRLLLLIVSSSAWREVLGALAQLFARGRELRDSQGMNRFRLVVSVTEVTSARDALEQRFAAAVDPDERMHLHVIPARGLAASLGGGRGGVAKPKVTEWGGRDDSC
jgi:hypothetical protein